MGPRPRRSTLFPYTTLFRSTNDFVRRPGVADEHVDALADGILARELTPCRRFADDGHTRRLCLISGGEDRKSTRLNSSHSQISYAVFCLKKKKKTHAYNTSA